MDKLLKSAKLREEDIAKTEELMMNNLSVEEVAERRNQLRKMRDLMFRADIKAKRVSKIKSKTYRRIRKKEKEKLMAKLGTEGEDDEDDEEARLKHEVERARERATLKHKNTGKWARSMKSRGHLPLSTLHRVIDTTLVLLSDLSGVSHTCSPRVQLHCPTDRVFFIVLHECTHCPTASIKRRSVCNLVRTV